MLTLEGSLSFDTESVGKRLTSTPAPREVIECRGSFAARCALRLREPQVWDNQSKELSVISVLAEVDRGDGWLHVHLIFGRALPSPSPSSMRCAGE